MGKRRKIEGVFRLGVLSFLCWSGVAFAFYDEEHPHESPLSQALERIQNLHGMTFEWTNAESGGIERALGLIGEEVERVYPAAVYIDREGRKRIRYSDLIPVLVEAVKEIEERERLGRREILDQVKKICEDRSRGASGTFPAGALTGTTLSIAGALTTDSSTAGSGTATSVAINSIGQPTLAATNNPVTTTSAYTNYIAGGPIVGSHETITNSIAFGIGAGALGGGTNSYGIYCNAQTGATNNYSAVFLGGNVGVGTTSPGSQMQVTSSTAAKKGLIVQGASSQSVNLQDWQDNTGATLSAIDNTGRFTGTSATVDDASISSRKFKPTWGTVLSSNILNLTNSAQDVPGATSTFTAATASTLLVTAFFDLSSLGSTTIGDAYGLFILDGSSTSCPLAHFVFTGGWSGGTVGTQCSLNVASGSHTIKLQSYSSQSNGRTASANLSYIVLSQ